MCLDQFNVGRAWGREHGRQEIAGRSAQSRREGGRLWQECAEFAAATYIYLDDKGKWRLVYIIEDVRTKPSKQSRRPPKQQKAGVKEADYARSSHHHADPVVFDYVVDANTGSLVAQLPRTPGVSESISSPDDIGKMRQIEVDRNGASIRLMDATLGIETYDFHFKDPDVRNGQLPGDLVTKPPALSTAAVSAHANASDVARFLRQTLMRNNIDNAGGRMVSSVNCVIKARAQPPGSQQWFNAFWDPDRRQMVYGQVAFNGALRTIAANLDVVAHEMFHGVTNDTSRLEYKNMSGALNESDLRYFRHHRFQSRQSGYR